jgi:hypothetical protein
LFIALNVTQAPTGIVVVDVVVDVDVVVVVLVAQQGTNVPLPIIVELPAGNIKEPTKASIVKEEP